MSEDRYDQAEREAEEREAAARDFSHIVFGAPKPEDAKEEKGGEGPVGSADAGSHGMEPENRKAPAEHLADLLLRGDGVPEDSRWIR